MALGHDSGNCSFDATKLVPELLRRIEKGEEVTLTKDGAPVARVVPIQNTLVVEGRRAAIERWRKASNRPTLAGLSPRDLIEEGRR